MKRRAPVEKQVWIRSRWSMHLLSLEALEARSMISRHTWRKWLRQGRLPAVRLGQPADGWPRPTLKSSSRPIADKPRERSA